MSTATKSAPAPRTIEYVEQFNCPRCHANVPSECVDGRLVPTDAGRTRRRLRMWCDQCQSATLSNFLLVGDRYKQVGTAETMRGSEKDAFLASIATLRTA